MKMNQSVKQSSNRRRFLTEATGLAAAGAVTIGAIPAEASRRGIVAIDLGIRPAHGVPGAVVVPKSDRVRLTFAATRNGVSGQAVVELIGCSSWKSEAGEDSSVTFNRDQLPLGSFEELNSSWAAERFDGNGLRHFIFTFEGNQPGVCGAGRHFECLAKDVRATFVPSGEEALRMATA